MPAVTNSMSKGEKKRVDGGNMSPDKLIPSGQLSYHDCRLWSSPQNTIHTVYVCPAFMLAL